MCVVSLTMGSHHIDIAPLVDGAVSIDEVMVSDVHPALRLVHLADVGYRVVAALGCGRAMHDDLVDSPTALLQRHIILRYRGRFLSDSAV